MRRRDLIAVGTVALAGAAATSALASESAAPAEGVTLNISGVGLPVVADGRLRNYVFVTVKLTLAPGADATAMRGKDPFFRDALVRTAHRAPFTVPGDWTKLNENAINAAMMAIANVVSGPGSVVKSEVLMQTPRRRTGVPGGA